MKRKILIFLIFLLVGVMISPSMAGNKTLFITGNGITSLTNDVDASVYEENIRFYLNNFNTDLTINDPVTGTGTNLQISGGEVIAPTSAGKNIMVNVNVNDTIIAIIWQGSYYAKLTLAMNQANYDNSTLTWNWTNAHVDYFAGAPAIPTISDIVEKMVRIDQTEDYIVNFDVAVAPGRLPGGGLSEGTTYRVVGIRQEEAFVQPSASAPNNANIKDSTSSPIALNSPADNAEYFDIGGLPYKFRAAAYVDGMAWGRANSIYYSEWSPEVSWISGAGGAGIAGGGTSIILRENPATYGINAIAIPYYTTEFRANDVAAANALELLRQINIAAGRDPIINGIVTTLTYWDPTTQQPVGITIPSGRPNQDAQNQLSAIALRPGMSVYVSINGVETVTLPISWQ